MPTCSEICPIAKTPGERGSETIPSMSGGHLNLISTWVSCVFVTVVESDESSHISSIEVPPGATPSCNLAARIQHRKKSPGMLRETENCVYVPGEKVDIVDSRGTKKGHRI